MYIALSLLALYNLIMGDYITMSVLLIILIFKKEVK